MSDNHPFIRLELSNELAQFLMGNCETNIEKILEILMSSQMASIQGEQGFSRPTLEKLITLSENFKTIREKLIEQGIERPDQDDS